MLLFALAYTGKQIPSLPRAFKMAAGDRLLYDVSSDTRCHSSRYSTPVLC
jgi:hypothetical protein